MTDLIRTVYWENDAVVFIDQRLLPGAETYVISRDYRQIAAAIKDLSIRGAPAIGVAAALGIALGVRHSRAASLTALQADFEIICTAFSQTRPTARNLFWAIEGMRQCFREACAAPQSQINNCGEQALNSLKQSLIAEACRICGEDIAINRKIGAYGETLIANGDNILTHCNAGALATAGYGTALGVVRAAWEAGKHIHVYVDETRPVLQGARLTAWELIREGIPATLITDNMSGFLMKQGRIQKIIVGADRIAANGDAANKIGTYSVAVLARAHKIPFYVAAPLSTFDGAIKTGKDIPIEKRDPAEVTSCQGVVLAPRGISVYNPAFDVTPHRYITAFVTEKGLIHPPFRKTVPPALRPMKTD
ncbi:MAG: S-methyl-5-thioribose-1-phosphate isomerase [Syntrophales bacterium]